MASTNKAEMPEEGKQGDEESCLRVDISPAAPPTSYNSSATLIKSSRYGRGRSQESPDALHGPLNVCCNM